MTSDLPRTYIRTPATVSLSLAAKVAHKLIGLALTPIFWLFAFAHRTPGLKFRAQCFALGMRLLIAPRGAMARKQALVLLLIPMDSTRYFEFDYVSRALAKARVQRYLDVSSPRLVPVQLMRARLEVRADLINPHAKDMQATAQMVNALGLQERCRLHTCLIEDAPFQPASFEVVTCVSVLEHIPQDMAAVRKMWELLKSGGTLVLTLPCMARASEQYIDFDEYQLLDAENGFVFWQRFYDSRLLTERIFSVTGPPSSIVVYGEKVSGSFFRNAAQKRRGGAYPFWREPYMMGRDYTYFERIDQLPGDGVVGLTFVKP